MNPAVVLLVDDEKTVLDALRRQVVALGGRRLRCETAEHVDEAWEVLQELTEFEEHVILVVSDWLMPGTRGDAFLADVRFRHPDVVRVMLTGQADPSALERVVREQLAHLVLSKPWRESDVQAALALALDP